MPVSAHLTSLFGKISLLTGLLILPALAMGQAFVQENSGGSASAATVNVTYTAAETAGNLNLVVVGWSDVSSSVTSVADDNGNTYRLVGTSAGATQSQAIYYAPTIAVATINPPTVTVTFNQAANAPDVRILEYSGLNATNPLDNWAGNADHSVSADSGLVVTSLSDLIVAAGTTATHFTAAGAGFTLRAITTLFHDIVEDSNVALPAGTHNGTADLANGNWVMQAAGFSATATTYTNPPTISTVEPISPTTGGDPGGNVVNIFGTNFQPGAVVLFGTAPGGLSGINCFESEGTTITCLTPADTAGPKDVTVINVDGKHDSALAAFTYVPVVPPTFGSIAPTSGPTNGSAVTITGTNFQVGAKVKIGGLPAGNVAVPDGTTITANTPGLPVGAADVTVTNPDGGTVTSTGGFTYTLGTGAINYIQAGDAGAGAAASTIAVSMPKTQTAGNLNVVLIGWNDVTATVSSVTDTEVNTYVAALPAASSSASRQIIYYAKNIAGDSGATPNTVTVTFSQGAQAPDARVLEYNGLDTVSPLDAVASNTGSGTTADTGACTTSTAVELVIAGATVGTDITDAGPGFTIVDLTHPNGNDAQHQITSAAGSCQATALLSATSDWVMQAATFKVPVPDFTVSATPPTGTVVAGSPAAYTVSVAGVHGFNSAVALTCVAAGLPAGASCAFVPTPVTPGVSAATSALTISTTASTPSGTSTVTIKGTSGSLNHTTTVSLTVNGVPDFSITGTALAPASVAAGSSATSTITVAALNGFNNTVNLSCSVTPASSRPPTCSFSAASVANGAGTSVLTVHTVAPTTASVTPPSRGVFFAMLLPIGALAFLGGGTVSRNKLLGLLLACFILPMLMSLAACGGGSSSGGGGNNGQPGTPAGAYTVTISSTSGTLTHSATVTLTVQ